MPHNGGNLQLNLFHPIYDEAYPFLNLIKNAATFVPTSAPYDATKHDENGWPHTIYGTSITSLVFLPHSSNRSYSYVLKWTGNGTVTAGGIGGSSAGAGSGRFTGTITPSLDGSGYRVLPTISAVGTPGVDYPHDIILCHADDEARIDAGEIFQQKFLNTLIDAKIGVIRFLDPQIINTSNVRKWSDRTPITRSVWTGAGFPLADWTSDLANIGDDYTCTVPGFTLVDRAVVHGIINATSTGYDPTLNVSGTGAKPIIRYSGDHFTVDTHKPYINKRATFIYEAVLDSYLMFGGSNSTDQAGITSGWPVEICVELCRLVGAHPWLCIPYLCLDPLSDYSTELATYMKAYKDNPANDAAWMIERIEPGNEIWNSIFAASRFAWNQENRRTTTWKGPWVDATAYVVNDSVHGTVAYYGRTYVCKLNHTSSAATKPKEGASWGTYWIEVTGHDTWYGRALSKVGKAVSAVYSDDRSKYKVICGTFAFEATNPVERLGSATYVTETGSASDAAANWIAGIANAALYWWSGIENQPEATTMAAEYAAATDARKIELVNEFVLNTEGGATGRYTGAWGYPNQNRDRLQDWADFLATDYPTLEFHIYEGGYATASHTGTAEVQAFKLACKSAPALVWATHRTLAFCESIGITWMSHYVFSGAHDWTAMDPNIYMTDSKIMEAMTMWANGVKRVKITTSVA